jgi:DNA-binding XRE family transcriptional regulator
VKVKVARSLTGCLEWTGVTRNGYGVVRFAGRMHSSHRLALGFSIGRLLGTEEFACHHCDNKLCVEVTHLFLGTRQDNMDDMVAKGRSAAMENHPNAKLTDMKLALIFSMRKDGLTQATIAATMGVSQTCISKVLTGKRWERNGWRG